MPHGRYYHHDDEGTAIIAHATDDLSSIVSSPEKKTKVLAMVADLYPKHTKEDPATVILGMTVEFEIGLYQTRSCCT